MRRRRWRLLGGLAAVVTALPAAAVVAAAPAGAATAADRPAPDGDGGYAVTLVTGDRVTVSGPAERPRVRFEGGPGREDIAYSSRIGADGHLRVVPADAAGLIASGRLDERLFDLTRLQEWGYDDAGRDDVPLLVRNSTADEAPEFAALSGADVLPTAGITTASVDKGDAARFWAGLTESASARTLGSGAERIWLDGRREALLDESVPQIGAPDAWEAGFDGEGVTVAVLDSGVDSDHPDLAGQIGQMEDFAFTGSPEDRYGHGTHVASIIAGTGASSVGHPGVAPGATLISGKVLDDTGGGYESDILAGMEWAADRADIVNMSLGGEDFPGEDPLEAAVNDLSERTGALFVIAAGNSGESGARTISSPSSADAALAVGAVDGDEALAPWSSRGPRIDGGAVKPEITAPGVDILGARAEGALPQVPEGGPDHLVISGTSMAAPHAAGAAALLAQRNPDWDGARLRTALTSTARPNPELGVYQQGAGRVDVSAAIGATVTPDTAGLTGSLVWPHGDGETESFEVAYTNSSAQPVTLTLGVADATAAGMFSAAAPTLTVPANGTATATFRATAPAGTRPGDYAARFTATHPGGTVSVPVAVHAEPAVADIEFRVVGADGRPVPWASVNVYIPGEEPGSLFLLTDGQGRTTEPLTTGEYYVVAEIEGEPTADGEYPLALVGQRLTVVDQPVTVTLDARTAEPVELVQDAPATPVTQHVAMDFGDTYIENWTGYTVSMTGMDAPGFHTFYGGTTSDQEGTGEPITTLSSAYAVHEDGLPADPSLDLRAASLARVDATMRSQGAAADTAELTVFPTAPDERFALHLPDWIAAAPSTMRFNLTPGAWEAYYNYGYLEDEDTYLYDAYGSPPVSFAAPGPARWELNAAVLGPSTRDGVVQRADDELGVFADWSLFAGPGWGEAITTLSSGTARVTRDGQTIYNGSVEELGWLEVPSAEARYVVTVDATRQLAAPGDISPRVQVEWGFDSATWPHQIGDPSNYVATPSVQFVPTGLDERNRAARGTSTPVHVYVTGPEGAVDATGLTVAASSDGGRTWTELPVTRSGGHWLVTVANPGAAGAVSLRASAADAEGNTVSQTITDAYLVR
ncbi:S8 family peptidase [Allonocardiopsis opalescens]|uniref:Subtilase family protein n=1 Tax=Allonocardiopsis opalescens TaxID=1144618 RepID=A0A2T0QES8_9ACTN|nr:S8 family serine peptidase [Allonocardiopsis opalescens]PRY02437.1 subtilase family protein [Allonocardiopsis opalescens]